MNLDFIKEAWFEKLWPLVKSKFGLTEPQAKLLSAMLCLGKVIDVNEVSEILKSFNACPERARADSVVEALRGRGLVRLTKSRPKKMYRAKPYEHIWPEIEGTYNFLRDCKAIIEQNQETIDFDEEVQGEGLPPLEKEHEVVDCLREFSREGHTFIILRDQVRHQNTELNLWVKIAARLRDLLDKGRIIYKSSKINAILILDEKRPRGLLLLDKNTTRTGAVSFRGHIILNANLAGIVYKNEVLE